MKCNTFLQRKNANIFPQAVNTDQTFQNLGQFDQCTQCVIQTILVSYIIQSDGHLNFSVVGRVMGKGLQYLLQVEESFTPSGLFSHNSLDWSISNRKVV